MKFSFSSLAIFIVALSCLLIDFSLKNWEKEERVIEWDVHSYYEYLPAYFIYDDIKFEKSDYRLGENRHLFWPVYTEDGKKVIKMTMGTAFFYAPFFFAAHVYASLTDYPEDGFSEPYKLFLLLSTVFYLILGMDILRKVLTHFGFSDKVIAFTILVLGLGTNLLCYASQSAPMSHVYSFCLFAAFAWVTTKWYDAPSLKNTVLLGLLLGWITLVRPTNAVVIIFFLLYGVTSVSDLNARFSLFKANWNKIFPFALSAFMMIVPQLIYWKFVTGKFICYSYNDEGFFFGHPRILEGLFSWRKGWFVYTPLILFAFAGLYFLRAEARKVLFPLIAFMTINIYIIFSWWCWWYGGTLGQRSFIESYALLAIPLASFIQFISLRHKIVQWMLLAVAGFFTWLNIFQTYQFETHALHYDSMTRQLYFDQFGKLGKIPDNDPRINWINYEEAKKGKLVETATLSEESRREPVLAVSINEKGRKTIQLKAYNGKYVCADEAAGNIVVANRDSAQGWETFTLILLEDNECALLSGSKKFFCAELDKSGELVADRDHISKWETFSLVQQDDKNISLKAANGKFVTMDPETGRLFASAERAGDKEKFEMIIK